MSGPPRDKAVAGGQAETRNLSPAASLNHTCQNCRRRKIKCIISTQTLGADTPKNCVRCVKLDLDCVFLPPAIRRRRNRNETRIKELERKLQEIQETIAASPARQANANLAHPRPPSNSGKYEVREPTFGNCSSFTPSSTPFDTSVLAGLNDSTYDDPVSRGLVSHDLAYRLYWKFCHDQAPIYPLVLPPANLTWEQARSERPALFRAILTAGSSSISPGLFTILFQNTGKFLVEEAVVNGKRSLDLVQAFLIIATWYCPQEQFQELKFSQYASLAATMVLDLRFSSGGRHQIPSPDAFLIPSEELKETCRTYLACYFLCSSIALSFRRPTVLRYGPWVSDCIKVLIKLPDMHVNDCRLVVWAKLQRIAEESLSVIGFENGTLVDFRDAQTRFVLNCGVERALRWMQEVPQDVLHGPLIMHYHMLLINLQEAAFYDGNEVSDFKPPFSLRPIPLAKNSYNEISIEVANALLQCIKSAQQIIHTFLSFSTDTLQSAPIIIYTRIIYASIVLVKFDISTRMPPNVAYILDDGESNPKSLMLQLLDKLGPAVGNDRFVVPLIFRGVLSRIITWYVEQFEEYLLPDEGNVIEPMMPLPLEEESSSVDINNDNATLNNPLVSQTMIMSLFDFTT